MFHSNAVILNPLFSLALSRFLLTIYYAVDDSVLCACVYEFAPMINGGDPFLFQNIWIQGPRTISSLHLLPEIKSNALERE